MSTEFVRYSNVKYKMPREFILIQGLGCRWKRCTFCDYHNDSSENPFEINKPVVEMITGEHGVLEVLNSGSAQELDDNTIKAIKEKTESCGIHTIWFESHWIYRNHLKAFANKFPNSKVKFRIGIETFDPYIRGIWKKGVPENVTAEMVAEFFDGVNILVGIKGQNMEAVKRDIQIAERYFEYFHVNLFCENKTDIKRDESLITQFINDIYPTVKYNPKCYTLLNITDLGVG